MKRFFYALGWFWKALTQPKVFQWHWFKLIQGMMKFLEKTAESGRPMKCELQTPKYELSKLGEINWSKGEYTTVLHLWCGVDNVDSPFKRISDLMEENKKLKSKINLLLSSEQNAQECDTRDSDSSNADGQIIKQ